MAEITYEMVTVTVILRKSDNDNEDDDDNIILSAVDDGLDPSSTNALPLGIGSQSNRRKERSGTSTTIPGMCDVDDRSGGPCPRGLG